MQISKSLARDAAKAIQQNKHEVTDGGIYIPAAGALLRGAYTHSVNGIDEITDYNNITDQGLLHLLGVVLSNTADVPNWYVSLFAGAVSPAASWTAASYPATAGEITSSVEGYTEATRQLFVASAPSGNAIDNAASKANYTIATASTLSINGAALVSESVKGSTNGVLMSATRFATTRVLQNGDVFSVGYRIVATSI